AAALRPLPDFPGRSCSKLARQLRGRYARDCTIYPEELGLSHCVQLPGVRRRELRKCLSVDSVQDFDAVLFLKRSASPAVCQSVYRLQRCAESLAGRLRWL